MALTLEDLIQLLNARCERGEWFWVAGLAKQCWPALWPIPATLHPVAAIAVEHYATEHD